MNFQPLLTENQTPHWRVDKDVCVLVQFLFFYHQILHFSLIHLCASFFPHSQLLGHKKGAFLNKSAQYILSFFFTDIAQDSLQFQLLVVTTQQYRALSAVFVALITPLLLGH